MGLVGAMVSIVARSAPATMEIGTEGEMIRLGRLPKLSVLAGAVARGRGDDR
jgi:hypothetical protein